MASVRLRPDLFRPVTGSPGSPGRPPRAPKPALDPAAAAAGRRRAAPLAWTSLAAGVAAVGLICVGDPYLLSLPFAVAAIAAGRYVKRRVSDQHPASHVGVMLGAVGLFLWLLVSVLVGRIMGVSFPF